MIAAVHACVGAALGRLLGRHLPAFAAGVVSHAVCDLLPHRDLDPKVEAPLLAATLGVIAATTGPLSVETTGAIGAISPDFENAASRVGLIPESAMVFPTHQGWHGRRTKTVLPQVVLAAACLAIALWPEKRSA